MTDHLIIPGTRQDYALLIKGGQGGSACGYRNKYLNLANEIRDKYGITVVSCATRDEPKSDNQANQIAEDVALVNETCKSHPKILFMGMSKGALLGCIYGSKKVIIFFCVKVLATTEDFSLYKAAYSSMLQERKFFFQNRSYIVPFLFIIYSFKQKEKGAVST